MEHYLLFFEDKISQDIQSYLKECLQKHGLIVEEEECPEHSVITVAAPFKMLLQEVKIWKLTWGFGVRGLH